MMNQRNKKVVLVVEDEPQYQKMLRERLDTEGFSVTSAEDGADGLEKSLATHPDLILLDLQMPTMTGTEMIKKLREDAWGKTAKVIILTNKSDPTSVADVISTDVFEYLVKADVSLEDLVEKIKKMIP